MAVIRDLSTKERDPAMYNKGRTIAETGATVVKVLTKRVYLRNAGRLEYLELDGAAAPPPGGQMVASLPPPPSGPALDPNMGDIDKGVTCNGNQCNVERQLVEKMLSNTAMLATAARFVPSIKDGKANGFKMYAIRPNSVFAKIGMQNGDTIQSINGFDMSSPDKALEVYTKVRSASSLSISILRRGQPVSMDYSIK